MFLFQREIIFRSRYSSFRILVIPWFTKSATSWWVLVRKTRGTFQCRIQKKFGDIDFSWKCWVVLRIWHYNNTYSGLKCVLFICNLENYKKDPLLIIFGHPYGWILSFWVWIRHCFWMSFETQLIKSPNLGNW